MESQSILDFHSSFRRVHTVYDKRSKQPGKRPCARDPALIARPADSCAAARRDNMKTAIGGLRLARDSPGK
jgi:hypothetical protein